TGYTWYAVASDGAYATQSATWSFTTADITVPGAPQNLQAVASEGQITLTWEAPSSDGGSPITNYKIYRGTSSGAEIYLATVGNVLTYTDTGLTNGQTYYYRVAAVNAVGEGSNATEVSATPTTVPSAPQNLQAIGIKGLIFLTWEAPSSDGGSPITNYKIYRGTSLDNLILLTVVGNVLNYTDTYVIVGETYYYRVVAVNAMGDSVQSSVASATVPQPGEPGIPGYPMLFVGLFAIFALVMLYKRRLSVNKVRFT
ncbi:MAG: Fibronectin type III domain protein, partial [Promethearchaeota archaeon CR_4]